MIFKGLGGKNKIKQELEEAFGKPAEKNVNINLVKTYFELNDKNESIIDGRTWDDLDMDDVFSFVDRTISKTGEQVLYDRLHSNY